MTESSRVLAYCRNHEQWLTDTIEALVRHESPTFDKAAVDRCGRELAGRLSALGGRVKPIASSSTGDHLRAEFGAGTRQILLLGHFDTVWPIGQLPRMPIARSGDELHGPGVLDMKAGISLGMLATRAVLELAPPTDTRIVMVWTTDEETGSETSRALLETESQRSEAVLVLEPALPGGVLKTRRKGCGDYEIVARGVAAHAGVDPGKGVSAIRELARQILAVEALQDLSRGVSVNVGIIEGGTRTNVVAAEARAHVDVRAPTAADADQIDLGQSVEEGATGGGSDGNFTAALGIPTLDGLGALGDGAHALHEHVLVSALVPRAALIALLIARLSA
jgi:glutamate carboxypeptidase